jgi:hypothetical protein
MMKRLSARFSPLYKRAFPVLWFGVLALAVAAPLASGASRRDPLLLVVPCAMAAVGYLVMKKLLWDLVDEVLDGGDYLVVRNRGEEDRVPLSNIMNVSAATLVNPPRITLRLITPGKFGDEIAFSPATPFSLNLFARNAIAEDLIVRVHRARTARPF